MSAYLWIILGTITGPFFLSFDKKVHFYTHWQPKLNVTKTTLSCYTEPVKLRMPITYSCAN